MVVDPRTFYPLDEATILGSLRKTSRALIVSEAPKRGGWGAELVARIVEDAFDLLDAPVVQVAAHNTPIPFTPSLEEFAIPQVADIVAGIRQVLA